MARDVDDMILESFGRSSDRKQPPSSSYSKRSEPSAFSDEDVDDEPMDPKRYSDNDDEDSDGAGRAPGPKMPVKKRIDKDDDDNVDDVEDDDHHRSGGDGYASDLSLSFGDDLYKDDADRVRLSKMSELEREMILHDRAEKMDNYKMRMRAAGRLKKDGGGKQRDIKQQREVDHDLDQPPPSARSRSSARDSSIKKDALNELVARRKKANDSDSQRRQKETARKPSPKRKRSTDSGSSESDASGSDDDDSSKEIGDGDGDGASDDEGGKLTVDDIANITIRRSKLAKWFLEPFFEEIVAGCFVRVGVGMRDNHSYYRLCQVKNVDARDPLKQYKFENRMTHKWLNLVWGDSEARWQMTRISDQPLTDAEFIQWKKEMDKSNARKPSTDDITEKREAIANLNSFVYSAALVKQMLQEKKMASSRPSNVAAEKDRLLKELALAESKDDHDEGERIQSRLKDLEAYSLQSQSKDAKALALAQMNKRNRFENFKNASDLKPANNHAKAGEAGYDPFSRRWTRSQNYYNRSIKSESTEATKSSEAATVAAQEAAADAGKLVDTLAPVTDDTKLFSLHDFDLPISLLGIQKFGGAQGAHLAFIARKQRLEATCGVPVQNNDGRRHMLTLTVNDYKRRRGLL